MLYLSLRLELSKHCERGGVYQLHAPPRKQPDGPARILDGNFWEAFLFFPCTSTRVVLFSCRSGREKMPERIELPQGTLDLLILGHS